MTRKGLASMDDHCDCKFCCYAVDNMKIHRLFRWVSPLVPWLRQQ
jgi:hypothetical protein